MTAAGVSYITWKSSLGLKMMTGRPPKYPPEKNGIDHGPKLDQRLAGACWSCPSLYRSQLRHQPSTWDSEAKKSGASKLLAS